MRGLSFVLLLACVCCRSTESRKDVVWLDDAALLAESYDDPEADAIVILHDQRFVFQAIGVSESRSELHDHQAVKILSEAAFERARVRLDWPADSELLHLEARTIAPDGTITAVDKTQFLASEAKVDVGEKSESFAARYFQFPRVEVGSILELSYTVVIDGLYTSYAQQISDEAPVREYRVEIVVDDIAVPQMLVLNSAARPTTTKGDDGFKHVKLVVKDIPAAVYEPLAPTVTATQPWWTYRTLRYEFVNDVWYANQDWADAARPVKKLIVDGKGLEEAPALDVGQCKGDAPCIIALAAAKTRELTAFTEFAVAFDHRPISEMLTDGVATSADKTVLLYALLKNAGLDARYVGAARKGTLKIKADFPSRRWLNHSLVLVKNGDQAYWIDPSCEMCAPGTLPSWAPIGEDVLVLTADKGEVSAAWWTLNGTRAPIENEERRTATVALERNGDATVSIEETQRGEPALFRYANTRNDSDEVARLYALDVVRGLSRAGKLLEHGPTRCDRERGVCTRTIKAFLPHAAHVSDDGLRLPLDMIHALDDLDPSERKNDVAITREDVDVDVIKIVPPAGMHVENAPRPATSAGGLVEVTTRAQKDGDALVVTRTAKMRPGRLPRAQIGPMQETLDAGSALSSFVVRVTDQEVAAN